MKRRAEAGVQMFSFLDAMVCTLGALLVLLHAFARHGQIEAVRKAEVRAVEEASADPAAEREMLEWRVEQLKLVRERTEAQLTDERLKLSHVEDHERRLQDKFKELQIAAGELQRLKDRSATDRDKQLAALEAARQKLAEERKAVETARRKGQHDVSYSVVPYEGPNHTRRRPVYIECRADAMVLQPEGIELGPRDFAGILGAGNPLASALRGEREYFARQATPGKPDSEPYPLLLVRPEGVKTYYAARSALDSWGTDFGYELIGEDWKLKYTEPDPQLAQLLRQIVADARMRMRDLAVATAQLNSTRGRTTLHASSRGGFVSDGPRGGGGARGGSRGAGPGGWDSLDSDWAHGNTGSSPGDDDATIGDPAGGSRLGGSALGGAGNGHVAGGDSATGDSATGGGRGGQSVSNDPRLGGAGNSAQSSGGGPSPYDHIAADGRYGGAPGGKTPGPQSGAYGQNSSKSSGTDSTSGEGYPDGTSDESTALKSGGPAGSRSSKTSGTRGSGGPTDAISSASASGAPSGSASSGGSSSSGSSSDGGSSAGGSPQSPMAPVGMPHSTIGSNARKTSSLAKTRGRDWGLPDGGMGMSPATRPILIDCYNDRLVIVPDERNVPPKETRLGPEARENIDEFVANVWTHMKGWGTAGKGLYWRPTLMMNVGPGAADRYAEVKSLLADSGLDVRERPQRTVTRPPAARSPR